MKNDQAVTVNGVEWRPFLVEFDTQEGTFGFEIFAASAVHAIEVLDDLKRTAKIKGEVFGRIKAGGRDA